MSETTRTRAEIQAEIEKLQAEMDAAWPQKGAQAYCKAEVTDNEDDGAEILIDGTDCFTTVPMDSLIPAADLIPREEHEALVRKANTRTDKVVMHFNAADAVDYLVDEYDKDWGDTPEAKARVYTSGSDAQYRVTVERVDAKDATTDNDHIVDANKMVESADAEPVGWANLHKGGAWSSMFSSARTARTCAEFGDWAETAVPLYRHPAPVAPTAVAPKGVVEFLTSIIEDAIAGETKDCGEPLCCTCRKYRDEARAALTRVTSLPEPSEWAREAVEIDYPLKNRTRDERLDLAAALLAKEGDHE